jgi:DNA-binding transcriptional LysR family regulator
MSPSVDLEEVGTFVRVVEAGSMRLAAERLGVPRSTISRRIARLEEMLDVTLLSRTTRKMALTPEGTAYFEGVAPAIRAILDATDGVQSQDASPRGTLRVTAPVDLSLSIMPEIIGEFVEKYPDVRVHLEVTNHYVDLIGEGFDMALRAGPMADSSLIARRVASIDFWIVASPEYLARRGEPAKPADLSEHTCLLFRPSGDRHVWTLTDGDSEIGVEVSGRMSATDFGFLKNAATGGAGIALLPILAAVPDLREGRLVRILEPWVMKGQPFSIVTRPGKHVPAKVRAFQQQILDKLESDCSEHRLCARSAAARRPARSPARRAHA